jgi:hypothetical protein
MYRKPVNHRLGAPVLQLKVVCIIAVRVRVPFDLNFGIRVSAKPDFELFQNCNAVGSNLRGIHIKKETIQYGSTAFFQRALYAVCIFEIEIFLWLALFIGAGTE